MTIEVETYFPRITQLNPCSFGIFEKAMFPPSDDFLLTTTDSDKFYESEFVEIFRCLTHNNGCCKNLLASPVCLSGCLAPCCNNRNSGGMTQTCFLWFAGLNRWYVTPMDGLNSEAILGIHFAIHRTSKTTSM